MRAGTFIKRHPIVEVVFVSRPRRLRALRRATLKHKSLQISVVTSLASYFNPLTRIGGVEYVAEVRIDFRVDSQIITHRADSYSPNAMAVAPDSALGTLRICFEMWRGFSTRSWSGQGWLV